MTKVTQLFPEVSVAEQALKHTQAFRKIIDHFGEGIPPEQELEFRKTEYFARQLLEKEAEIKREEEIFNALKEAYRICDGESERASPECAEGLNEFYAAHEDHTINEISDATVTKMKEVISNNWISVYSVFDLGEDIELGNSIEEYLDGKPYVPYEDVKKHHMEKLRALGYTGEFTFYEGLT